MKPIKQIAKNVESNCTYIANDCEDLPVFKQDNDIISCWQLTWKERLQLLLHGKLYLRLIGSQPPVLLYTSEKDIFGGNK